MNKLTVIIPAILLSGNVFAYCAYDDFDCSNREAEQAQMRRDIEQQRIDFDQMRREQERERQEMIDEQNRRDSVAQKCRYADARANFDCD